MGSSNMYIEVKKITYFYIIYAAASKSNRNMCNLHPTIAFEFCYLYSLLKIYKAFNINHIISNYLSTTLTPFFLFLTSKPNIVI